MASLRERWNRDPIALYLEFVMGSLCAAFIPVTYIWILPNPWGYVLIGIYIVGVYWWVFVDKRRSKP